MTIDDIAKKYLLQETLLTYDPYDVWKTALGIKVKQLYYKHNIIGILPAGFLTIYDLYINNRLRLGLKKQEYPIVRAQAILSLINMYKREAKVVYIGYIKKHIDWLLNNSSKGYSGVCWGTGFKIVISDKIVYDANVPFSTNTPYVLEAFFEYYNITNDKKIFSIIESMYQFYEKDLVVLEENDDILVTSYGPFKDRIVTNSVAYTMYAYSIFYHFIEEKEYIKEKIRKMYNFIVSVQLSNGSWLYAPYDDNSFIDCFHSAFILKNLIKTSKNIDINVNDDVINKGYNYIINHFYDKENGLFKRFSLSNKPSLVKFDLYDNAEMLNLSKLMNDLKFSQRLENNINRFYSMHDIYSVIDIFNIKKNKNTLRWAVMPYILAKSIDWEK